MAPFLYNVFVFLLLLLLIVHQHCNCFSRKATSSTQSLPLFSHFSSMCSCGFMEGSHAYGQLHGMGRTCPSLVPPISKSKACGKISASEQSLCWWGGSCIKMVCRKEIRVSGMGTQALGLQTLVLAYRSWSWFWLIDFILKGKVKFAMTTSVRKSKSLTTRT